MQPWRKILPLILWGISILVFCYLVVVIVLYFSHTNCTCIQAGSCWHDYCENIAVGTSLVSLLAGQLWAVVLVVGFTVVGLVVWPWGKKDKAN